MKKILLSAALFVASMSMNAQVIDFNYEKFLEGKMCFFDFNGNGKVDNKETIKSERIVLNMSLSHHEYGDNLDIVISIYSKNDTLRMAAQYKDVVMRKLDGGYHVENKLDETLLLTLPDENYGNIFCVFDFTPIREIKK